MVSQKNKGGKIIPTKPPSQSTQQHLNQISSILQSPKKCTTTQDHPQNVAPNHRHHYVISTPPVNPNIQQQIPGEGSTHTTLPGNMVSQIDYRFSLIETTIQKHQEYNENFNNRLCNLEKTTLNTDTKIDMILNKMETLANPSKQCKVCFSQLTNNDTDCEMIENIHPNSHRPSQISGCIDQCL